MLNDFTRQLNALVANKVHPLNDSRGKKLKGQCLLSIFLFYSLSVLLCCLTILILFFVSFFFQKNCLDTSCSFSCELVYAVNSFLSPPKTHFSFSFLFFFFLRKVKLKKWKWNLVFQCFSKSTMVTFLEAFPP